MFLTGFLFGMAVGVIVGFGLCAALTMAKWCDEEIDATDDIVPSQGGGR